MAIGNDPEVDALIERCESLEQDVVALQSECDRLHNWTVDCTKAANVNVSLGQANFNALIGAVEELRGHRMNDRRLIARAQTRHVMSTVPTRELLQPESRGIARALRTWAKPKGWRL